MEEKKQGFLGAYKCLVFFAVMMAVAIVIAMVKPKAETYTATASGFVGEVTVQVSVMDGKITAVQILNSTESAGIADPALEQIPAAILKKQNVDVDVVAGASYASRAIMTAVADCMTQAGLTPAAVPEPETAAPEGNGEAAEFGPLSAGTYTATAQGFLSEVTVTVTVDEAGTITEVAIDAAGETPALGGAAAESLQGAIVEAQGTAVDTVTGATFTSKAVISALTECLTEASK